MYEGDLYVPRSSVGGATSYADTVLSDSPVSYWKLTEPAGLPQDTMGVNNVSVVTGTPTYGVAGALLTDPANTAMTFDGVNESLVVPDNPSLDTGDMFTLEAWVKRSVVGVPGDGFIMQKGDTSYRLGFNNDGIEIAQKAVAIIAISTVGISDTTTWHHVVWTKNGAANAIYLDGVDVTGVVTNATILNTADPLEIAESNGGFLAATLDEVAIYPTALAAARVAAHYAAAGY